MMRAKLSVLLIVVLLLMSSSAVAADSSFVVSGLRHGQRFTTFIMSYTNLTKTALIHLTVQCVGFSEDGLPVGEAQKAWDVRLNDVPISPKQTVYHEMLMRHGGHEITSVRCAVIKSKKQ